jgi:hypothetical protein
MCTYITKTNGIKGAAKTSEGWQKLSHANVYLDHPFKAPYDHSLNIDFINEEGDFSKRIALELDPESARALVESITKILDSTDF